MRMMVTGGAGFIGSALVDRLLAEGHEVDVVDDLSAGSLANLADARAAGGRALRIHQLDVRFPETTELIARRRPAVVYHLAAQVDVERSVDDPVFDAEVNVVGTLRVLEGAREAGTDRVVFTASGGSLYGDVDPDDLPIKESCPHRPLSPYGVSKQAALGYLASYRETHALEFCALAVANVYGPRRDPREGTGVVARFAKGLVEGQRVTVFGDGEHTRDYVYLDDVVDALARAATRGGGLVCNIGTGTETSVNELYRVMAAAAGVEGPPAHAAARPGDLARSALDPGRAAIHLGWKPWTPLAQGVAAVLEAHERRARRGGGQAGRGGQA